MSNEKSELIDGNLKQFIKYINLMDLVKINQCNEWMQMKLTAEMYEHYSM